MFKEINILGGARTPMAEFVGSPGGGKFNDLSAIQLGAIATKAALERTGVSPDSVDQVVMGNVLQTSVDAIYGARHVALHAGVPIEIPALTVNRLCGSGLESVVQGAQLLQLGEAELVVSGGMENMSQAPHVIRGARKGFHLGQGALEDSLMASLKDPYCDLFMAQTAENLARDYEISREAQDEFALLSTQRCLSAQESGVFADEMVPVEVQQRKKSFTVDRDDHVRPDSSAEGLARLRPSFGKEGTVTAGNASGIVDGGAALVLTSSDSAKGSGRPLLGKVRGWCSIGVDPSRMGIGPAPAIRGVLDKCGVTLDQVDLFEINEAFAAQYLAVERELELDRDKVNVNGGAIALGHPLGMTGTRLILTLLCELKRRGGGLGVASACIGGGQGIAVLVESAGS